MLSTATTTLVVFAVFFVQGVMVARILGPEARGEFGKILYFPRDLLLYVGLLGSLDLIAALAARGDYGRGTLRRAALRLAWWTGIITLVGSLLIASAAFVLSGKAYLLPYCLLVACFLPLEHSQLTLGAVDRGAGDFQRYNWQRLFYAGCFPALLLIYFGTGWSEVVGASPLMAICLLFVVARLIGVVPTWWNLWADRRSGVDRAIGDLSTGRLLRQGKPFAWSLLATETFERLDLLLIVLLASFVEAGHYFVAVPAAALLTIVPNALSAFAFNAGSRREFQLSRRAAVKYLVTILGLQAVSVTAAYFLFPPLIRVIFGAAFEPAIGFALLLLPASALRGYLQFADAFLKARGRATVGIRARISSAVLMLIFVGLTYREWGLASIPVGAAVGQMWSATVISLAVWQGAQSQPGKQPVAAPEETQS